MTDVTQLSDEFLLQASLGHDSPIYASRGKTIARVDDNRTGYKSGMVTIDGGSALTGSRGFASLREAYITIPFVITAKNTGTASFGGVVKRFAAVLKTGVWNIVSDLSVEMNGKTIITQNEYKQQWANLRAKTETSYSDMLKHRAETFLYPDDWNSINFAPNAAANGDGFGNNSADPSIGLDSTLGQTQENRAFNQGVFDRMTSTVPMVVDESTHSSYGWPTLGIATSRTVAAQNARGAFIETSTAAAGVVAGMWIYQLKIRLVDLHPLFGQLDLVGSPQLKINYRVCTGRVDIGGSLTTMSLASVPTLVSGNVCPILVGSADVGNPMNNVIPATNGQISFAWGALQNEFTTIDTVSGYVPNTCTSLYVPFYDLVDPRPLIEKPLKTVRYLDCYAQYFKAAGGTGVGTAPKNAPVNITLGGTHKNVKYVALIPYSETSSGHFATAHGTEQFASPFDSAPWTHQPGSSVRNFQVQIGSTNVFAKTVDYEFESFTNEFAKLGAMNGDVSRDFNTGLIDQNAWTFAHRVMVADCSRVSEKDVPASIQISCVNNCSQGSSYLVFVVYERELTIDRLTGEVDSFN